MSDERLRELYAAAQAGHRRPGTSHPSPEAIAALARREGSEARRLATLDHVMSCADCRRELDLLRSIEHAGVAAGSATRPSGRRAWLMPAALAASLLVAVGVGREALHRNTDTTRGGSDDGVVLVQPGATATAGTPVVFAWRPVAGASRYELEVLDARGSVAASAVTRDTSVSPASAGRLPPGEYRWWVRATTSDARALRSDMRPLRLTGK
jgi:hypothetical protein